MVNLENVSFIDTTLLKGLEKFLPKNDNETKEFLLATVGYAVMNTRVGHSSTNRKLYVTLDSIVQSGEIPEDPKYSYLDLVKIGEAVRENVITLTKSYELGLKPTPKKINVCRKWESTPIVRIKEKHRR